MNIFRKVSTQNLLKISFFDTFFSNIDLKLDENKFLEWFQEQIVVAKDALIMM